MDMQEIGSGLLNSQFGIFIRVWIRHLGVMRLLDVGLAGPVLMSVEAAAGASGKLRTKTADFGWLKAQTSASGIRDRCHTTCNLIAIAFDLVSCSSSSPLP